MALLALTAATFTVGWAQKLPCRIQGYGPGNTYAYSRLCYTDVYVAWTAQGLDQGKVPYLDQPVEYPVLLGGIMAVAAIAADSADEFFDRSAVLLLLGALVVTATTALLLGPTRRAAAILVAVAPGMILHGTVNWDLAAAALAGLGLLAWSRRRPALAGVLLGIGAAVKLYPIVFLVPLLILCLRQKRLRSWTEAFVGAMATWVFCNAAVAAVAGSFAFTPNEAPRNAVLRFFVFNRDRPPDWDSLWFVGQQLVRSITHNQAWAFPVFTVNLWSAVLLLAGMAAMALLLWRSAQPAEVGQAAFLAIAIFVLTSKVFSPQYCIWLIPLAVLAGVRWPLFLTWQALELVLVYSRFAYFDHLADPSGGLPIRYFVAAVVARDLAVVAMISAVVRDVRQAGAKAVATPSAGEPASQRFSTGVSAA